MIIKNKKTGGIKFKNCECCLEYTSFKDDSVEYKCLYCHKIYQKKFDESLKTRFLFLDG